MTQQPPPGWGPPATGYGPPARNHPRATTSLVLGILGIVVCGVIAPFAWSMGGRVVREIDASGGQLGGRSEANAGRVLGIIGTVLLVGGFVVLLAVLVFGVALTHSSTG